MSRFVEPRRAAAETAEGPPAGPGDDYFARVAKYVPSEIVAAYVAVLATLDPSGSTGSPLTLVLCRTAFLVLWACTPLYLVLLGRGRRRAPLVQVVVSSLAFVVWAYALRGLSCAFPAVPFHGDVAFVALVLFTVVSGLFAPRAAAG